MIKQLNISTTPRVAGDSLLCKEEVAKKINIPVNEITHFDIVRRSVDARGRSVRINLGVKVYIGEEPESNDTIPIDYNDVSTKPEVIIIGAGPAGLFAALKLIELGVKPIVIERGKDVSNRKKDIGAIHRNEGVNPDSNYGFGEGGAGTFSDGKLYTRSKKRGDSRKILDVLFLHGAQKDILIDAHPHIGTNVLPKVITNIRETILNAGGEIHFNKRVIEFILKGDQVAGVKVKSGETFTAKATILATGHSARDIYKLLRNQGIHLEQKNFAVGVRVEHPQVLIDSIQYNRPNRGKYLPPATYNFTEQVNKRGVYSFCMCPGGVIVPAATSNNELVVNGMSPSHRGGNFANSGIVVEVRRQDLKQYERHQELAGLYFQEALEQKCFKMADESQFAPAQRLSDFVNNKKSATLPETSYHPGILSSNLNEWLPNFVKSGLQQGFTQIGQKAKGFLSNDAIILGVESRTSSPIRIPRDAESLQHVKIGNLFPCGEGAGYAGGIVSSAVDGERCAEKAALLVIA